MLDRVPRPSCCRLRIAPPQAHLLRPMLTPDQIPPVHARGLPEGSSVLPLRRSFKAGRPDCSVVPPAPLHTAIHYSYRSIGHSTLMKLLLVGPQFVPFSQSSLQLRSLHRIPRPALGVCTVLQTIRPSSESSARMANQRTRSRRMGPTTSGEGIRSTQVDDFRSQPR